MVSVSTLLPVELMCHICEDLRMTDLLALMRCSQLGRQLVDFELWRRLVHLIFPFLNLSHTLLSLFFCLLEATGLAILGDIALDLLLFGDPMIPRTTDQVKTLDLAVNIAYFSRTVEFFQKAGYDITTTCRDDPKEPEPENVLGKAEGTLQSDKLESTNCNWTCGECKSYCPRKRRNVNDDPGILAYRWIRSLDRSGAYPACQEAGIGMGYGLLEYDLQTGTQTQTSLVQQSRLLGCLHMAR
ncbi:hypothetical protein BKA70DRAFT_1236730 [Coprinopsis sp. MPI-PUGE-AT-0042]|nr:hypothetical protein BKA70DRAFT_1236730 [Coprinopsis sp. MPI-PUGE-AT-0042]